MYLLVQLIAKMHLILDSELSSLTPLSRHHDKRN